MATTTSAAAAIQTTSHTSPDPNKKAVVIGLYGLPGSGKSFVLNNLEQHLSGQRVTFYEGSEVISSLIDGGLEVFQQLDDNQKSDWRQKAIEQIERQCVETGHVAVVTGHFMFWPEGQQNGTMVYTPADLKTFTHIVYLEVLPVELYQRRRDDKEKQRKDASPNHLGTWQKTEKNELYTLCRNHNILFSVVRSIGGTAEALLTKLLMNFHPRNEGNDMTVAISRIAQALGNAPTSLETMLVMDGDRTLAADDTGATYWKNIFKSNYSANTDPLKRLFGGPMGYSYIAFRQAVLLYETATDDTKFDALCQKVAESVVMYPTFVALLQRVAKENHIGAVVITCGLRLVWEKVLERYGLSESVKVIGGGRIDDGYVVTPAIKAVLVHHLKVNCNLRVWAFGDSLVDIGMLSEADQAIVVVGDELTRSKTMDSALLEAIENNNLQARQAVLSNNASPRLDTAVLPLIDLSSSEAVESIFHRNSKEAILKVFHATNRTSAKLLMSPMRDSTVAGPALRETHRHVGWYLATEFLGDVLGIEDYPITHVQGHKINGHRVLHEKDTIVVALMRGGEPMAAGINNALPLASFLHAHQPSDITIQHLEGKSNVILVDSVVNSGKTIVDFAQHVHELCPAIRISVVVGVAQADSIRENGFVKNLPRDMELTFVALRLSDNKFTGSGATDTGNRLFNTTNLD